MCFDESNTRFAGMLCALCNLQIIFLKIAWIYPELHPGIAGVNWESYGLIA
jgi:hypothetical protein